MSFYDEIEIEDMTYHESTTLYTYPCPCGDQFEISLADLHDGEEVAVCPSCSLTIKVIFEVVSNIVDHILRNSEADIRPQDSLPKVESEVSTAPMAVTT